MKAYILDNGNLLIPKRAETDNVIGDGMIEIDNEHPDYKLWIDYAVPISEKDKDA